jgi:hypothetical protein
MLAMVEVSADGEAREPLLIQAAEVLGSTFDAVATIGRWEQCRFCMVTAGLSQTTVEDMLHTAAGTIVAGLEFSVTPLDPHENLEEVLVENSQANHTRARENRYSV